MRRRLDDAAGEFRTFKPQWITSHVRERNSTNISNIRLCVQIESSLQRAIQQQVFQSASATISHEDASTEPEKDSFNRLIDGFIAASPSYPPLNERALEPNDVFRGQDLLHRYMQQTPVAPGLSSSSNALDPLAESTSMIDQQRDCSIVPLHGFPFFERDIQPLDARLNQSNATIHDQHHSLQPISRFAHHCLNTAHIDHTMPYPHLSHGGIRAPTQRLAPLSMPTYEGYSTRRSASRILYQPADDSMLSEYQCTVRKQIEVFAADEKDVEDVGSGRSGWITVGQVGLRCCHCAHLPPSQRARGSTAFPTRLDVLYQTAQNLAKSHLEKNCLHISQPVREILKTLRIQKQPSGQGKQYWAESVQELGVIEERGGLRFASA